MADVISRLKLESGEFDSKIKRAAQGIQRMAEECHNAGGILNQLEDENRAYIQSLGSMATVATTAKGKLAELTAAFTDIRSQYNALSDEEKQGEFGQELNRQLEIMKGRINDAKTELSDISRELGNTGKQSQETGGFLDKLKDRFVVNLDAMKLFNAGLKAAEGALNVAKDAFLASEANVDMWGRTMEASEALYEGFCNALNRSDFSGFLSRIDEIVSAAKEAYNALDELGTYRTIQRPENAKRAAEETRLRTMLRTGRYIASTNGAKSAYGLKEGDVLTDEARAGYQRSLERLMTKTISETRRNISKTQNAVDKLYNEIASTSGISRADFKNTIQNWDTYQSTFRDVKNYNDWNDKNVPWYVKYGDKAAYGLYVAANNPYYNSRTLAWRDFRDSGDKFNRAQSLAEESYGLSSQLYSSQMRNYRALNAGGGRNGGGGRGGRGDGRGGQQQEEHIAQTQKLDFSSVAGYMLNPLDIEGSLEAGRRAAEEMERIKNLWQGIGIEDRTYTITIDDADAVAKLNELKGVDIEAKTFEITTEDKDALEKVKEIQGVTVEPKTFAITADDADALEKVKEIQGATIKPKEFAITSNGAEAIAKLKDIDGIKIDKKDFTLTANYEEAIEKVKAVDGVTIEPKTFAITADNTDALAKLKEIDGIKIEPKTVTITTEEGEGLKDISGVSILSEGKLPGLQGDISMLDMSSPIEAVQAQLAKADTAYQSQNMDAEQRQKEAQKQAIMEGMAGFSDNLGKMTSGIGQIASGVQQLGIKVPAGISKMLSAMQAITSILTAIQTLDTIKGWFHTGGVVKAATGYTVPGNYGFDAVPAMLTSGETVLTRAQAGNLASQLRARAAYAGGGAQPYVMGEQIFLGAGNYTRATGQGEIVTTSMLRRMGIM